MKSVHYVALLLAVVGAINWGLVGAFNFNLVTALLGSVPAAERVVYILVGLSGLVVAMTTLGMAGDRSADYAGARATAAR